MTHLLGARARVMFWVNEPVNLLRSALTTLKLGQSLHSHCIFCLLVDFSVSFSETTRVGRWLELPIHLAKCRKFPQKKMQWEKEKTEAATPNIIYSKKTRCFIMLPQKINSSRNFQCSMIKSIIYLPTFSIES